MSTFVFTLSRKKMGFFTKNKERENERKNKEEKKESRINLYHAEYKCNFKRIRSSVAQCSEFIRQ